MNKEPDTNIQQPDTRYKLVCGLEIHAELKTESKMFCGCKNDPFHAEKPNIYTCPVCLGMPGGLPVANKKAIEMTIKLGLALGCKINLFSKFDRKNYFYPDLPKGYQISQYDIPFCYDGKLETSEGTVGITRIHLEEDTGKLSHTEIDGEKVSLVDFNRGGVPLIEIVSEPDIRSANQAKEYAKKLRTILRYLDLADCDMEQGGMRLEANISLRKGTARRASEETTPASAPSKSTDLLQSVSAVDANKPARQPKLPNYKVEVKNINSFRFMEQAINYEIERHAKILDAGETPVQETRGFNPKKGETFSQRTKEDAEDYRYFPDPDIPPIRFTQEQIDNLKSELPDLPVEVVKKWEKVAQIEPRYGSRLATSQARVAWVDSVITSAKSEKVEPNKILSAIINKKIKVEVGQTKAQKVIDLFKTEHQTDEVDESELQALISTIVNNNPKPVEQFKAGETKVIGFFIGQVMQKAGKKLDVRMVRKLLVEELEK